MIYIDKDYYLSIFDNQEPEDNDDSHLHPKGMESFDSDDDDEDDDFDEEAFDAMCQKFADDYMRKVFPLTLDLYPQFCSKKAELKEALLKNGTSAFEGMYDLYTDYIENAADIESEQPFSSDITIEDINTFVRNSTFDYLLENYDAWFKRKLSFENIYVENFLAGVYVKRIHNILLNMLHIYFPSMSCLPTEQLDCIYSELTTDAWYAYSTITSLDPDELNESSVLQNLEDYEFEPLLRWKGPEITRNEKGHIVCIGVERNLPTPDKVPSLCARCKSFYDPHSAINILCIVSRYDQRNSGNFRCRAYEKNEP